MRIIALAASLALAGCWQSGTSLTGDGGSDGGTDGGADGTPDGSPGDGTTHDTWTEPLPEDPPWDVPDVEIPGECPGGTTRIMAEIPRDPGRQMVDLLIVVDDTRSMAEEQAMLVESLPILISGLLDPPADPATGLPEHAAVTDLHVGVVSTDMGTGGYVVETCSDPIDGDDGILHSEPSPSVPGCAPVYPAYLTYQSDTPDTVAIEEMITDVGCIATLGTSGCGWEQPLKAARRAFAHAHAGGPNHGFLRDSSIRVVVFLTDEDDGSVGEDPESEIIFDTTRTDLGHLNLRVFLHPYMLEPVEMYIEFLGKSPGFIVELIVGVPEDPACEGPGNAIGGCLDHPLMIEEIDPADPTRLRPSCNTSTAGLAFPPRRLVQVAQGLGDQALVHSICGSDLSPAMQDLTERIQGEVDVLHEIPWPIVPAASASSPCVCTTGCTLIEVLADLRSCESVGKPCWEPEGAGTGCGTLTDGDGIMHSLCVIPEAGSVMSPCDPGGAPACDDPWVEHDPAGEGWWLERGFAEGWVPRYTPGYLPEEGSTLFLECCL